MRKEHDVLHNYPGQSDAHKSNLVLPDVKVRSLHYFLDNLVMYTVAGAGTDTAGNPKHIKNYLACNDHVIIQNIQGYIQFVSEPPSSLWLIDMGSYIG